MTHRTPKAIRADLKTLRADMKLLGIKRTSCFNGGMSREAQRYNERVFALETELDSATRAANAPCSQWTPESARRRVGGTFGT